MKNPNDQIKTPGAEGPPDGAAAPQAQEPTEPQAPASKPPPPLPPFFMLSHLEEDGPVRLDGVKLGVCEVMGLEIDEPKLGAFAGALNALDFPAQLLIRQHPPRLGRLRENLKQAQPENLPPQTRAAAESLQRLLADLEARNGILDRRFYAVCEFERADELRGLLARAGLSVHTLRGRQLRMFLVSAALGGSPSEFDEEMPVEVEVNRRDVRVGESLVRSLHLGKWPRSLAPGFLQSLMAAGAPMDLSVHLGPIPTEQAARTLEWQKVRFESAQSLSFKRGRTMSPEAEIALEDVTRLRDEVQRGRERLFHASLSITLHAKDEASLREMTQRAKAHFAATLGKLDALAFRQREGLLSTLPLALNAVAEWRTLDTSSIARLSPFSPPDLDTRSGTLYGIDMRACAPVVYDPWDGTHLNANTAVLARSGSGKSFATKLGVLRGITRGITAYVIDPEGEYADMARAAGGRVLSPGVPGQGMNPFVIERGDSEELLQRIGSLRRLIEVMVGESLGAERRASLDHALAGYYAQPRERTGFRDFYEYLQGDEAGGEDMARLLRPFATGSLRNLLSDEGDDLLSNEALITVFDLRLLHHGGAARPLSALLLVPPAHRRPRCDARRPGRLRRRHRPDPLPQSRAGGDGPSQDRRPPAGLPPRADGAGGAAGTGLARPGRRLRAGAPPDRHARRTKAMRIYYIDCDDVSRPFRLGSDPLHCWLRCLRLDLSTRSGMAHTVPTASSSSDLIGAWPQPHRSLVRSPGRHPNF